MNRNQDGQRVLVYRFDQFVLDVEARTLKFRNLPVPVTPKAFQTLEILIRSSGQVIEKEQFLDQVWADRFVGEATLAQNIRTLRKALGAFRPGTEFIITVPRRGYRFVARTTASRC